MATPGPNSNNKSPSNHPPFITFPPTYAISRIPQATQTQTDASDAINNDYTITDHDDNYIHYRDTDFVHQTPQRVERLTSVPNAPIVYSPERANISGNDALAKSTAKSKKKRTAARKQMEQMHKHQKKVVSHSAVNNVFQFVRKPSIDSIIEDTTSIPTSRFDTIMCSANSHWKGNTILDLDFKPFATVDTSLMESSHHLLTHEHHRLLLEEIMLLTVRSEFTCTVSADHYFLN